MTIVTIYGILMDPATNLSLRESQQLLMYWWCTRLSYLALTLAYVAMVLFRHAFARPCLIWFTFKCSDFSHSYFIIANTLT